MSSEIKQAMDEFSQLCVPSNTPWEQIRARIEAKEQRKKTNWIFRHKKLSSTIVGAAVIVSGVFGGALVSPSFAVALDKTPGVNQVYDWLGDPGLEQAAVFDSKMHISSVDRGIKFTVTDAYYDQGRLALQYQVNLPDRMIGVPAGAPQMKFYINGKQVSLAGMGGVGATSDTTWHGMYEVLSTSCLPQDFNLQIAIHQIGSERGYWQIQVPVSGSKTFKNTQTYKPNVTRTDNETTLTLNDVTITPATVMVDYHYTGNQRLHLALHTADDIALRPISSQVVGQHANGSTVISDVVDVFTAPKATLLKDLTATPVVVSSNHKLSDPSFQIPLS